MKLRIAVGTLLALLLSLLANAQLANAQTTAQVSNTYVGSQACATCHAATFARWQKTRMANVIQDPKVHPEAIVGNFSKPDPPRHFQKGRHRLHVRQ